MCHMMSWVSHDVIIFTGQIEVNVEAAATRVEVGNIELGKAVSYKVRWAPDHLKLLVA